MDDHVYFIDQMSDEKILALLKAHQTFFLKGANDENKYRVIEIIEKTLGELGMKHKFYIEFPISFMRCAVSNFEFIVATRLCVHKIVKWGRQKMTWSHYYEIEDRLFVRVLAVKYNKSLFSK
jgi:hypothetical protein